MDTAVRATQSFSIWRSVVHVVTSAVTRGPVFINSEHHLVCMLLYLPRVTYFAWSETIPFMGVIGPHLPFDVSFWITCYLCLVDPHFVALFPRSGSSMLVAADFGRRQGSLNGVMERRKYRESLRVRCSRKWATIMWFSWPASRRKHWYRTVQ